MPVSDPLDYVQKVVELARAANRAGTFAVAGLLVDHKGSILKEVHNNVVRNGRVYDPTAHGERQLISWYYQTLESGTSLPAPSELTIITSLDPCLMCTGAILRSGINVVVIAYDDIGGVNWNRNHDFIAVPEPTRPAAIKQFSYLGVDDGSRHFVGPSGSIFINTLISSELVTQSFTLAKDSIENVRKINRTNSNSLVDTTSASDSTILRSLRNHYTRALELNIDLTDATDRGRLLEEMLKVAAESKAAGGTSDSAALIDQFRNILLILGSSSLSANPIDTPLMRLTRIYASCRHKDPEGEILPHPSLCSIILLHGPAPTALGIMDLGAFGLTMGPSESPRNLYFFRSTQSEENLAEMVQNLPPLFRDVMKITPVKLRI